MWESLFRVFSNTQCRIYCLQCNSGKNLLNVDELLPACHCQIVPYCLLEGPKGVYWIRELIDVVESNIFEFFLYLVQEPINSLFKGNFYNCLVEYSIA